MTLKSEDVPQNMLSFKFLTTELDQSNWTPLFSWKLIKHFYKLLFHYYAFKFIYLEWKLSFSKSTMLNNSQNSKVCSCVVRGPGKCKWSLDFRNLVKIIYYYIYKSWGFVLSVQAAEYFACSHLRKNRAWTQQLAELSAACVPVSAPAWGSYEFNCLWDSDLPQSRFQAVFTRF